MELTAMIGIGLVWLIASAYMDHVQRKRCDALISRISQLTQQASANNEIHALFSTPRSNAKTSAEPAIRRHDLADAARR